MGPAELNPTATLTMELTGPPRKADRGVRGTLTSSELRAMGLLGESARAPVVHGDRAATERLRRDQLEPSRAGQPALIQGRQCRDRVAKVFRTTKKKALNRP